MIQYYEFTNVPAPTREEASSGKADLSSSQNLLSILQIVKWQQLLESESFFSALKTRQVLRGVVLLGTIYVCVSLSPIVLGLLEVIQSQIRERLVGYMRERRKGRVCDKEG